MIISKNISILICMVSILTFSIDTSNANSIISNLSQSTYLDKFHAHQVVRKLIKKNIKDIEFIEIIVKNFGYIDNYKLRKDYWKANLLVTAGEIIKAKTLFEKNRTDINNSLKIISTHYKKDTLKILEECIIRLSSMKIDTYNNDNSDKKDKLIKNQKRIKLAYEELKNAKHSFSKNQFKNSINLYRLVKKHAITVLKDISTKSEQRKVFNKYKIHIVDNQHEIYKKG